MGDSFPTDRDPGVGRTVSGCRFLAGPAAPVPRPEAGALTQGSVSLSPSPSARCYFTVTVRRGPCERDRRKCPDGAVPARPASASLCPPCLPARRELEGECGAFRTCSCPPRPRAQTSFLPCDRGGRLPRPRLQSSCRAPRVFGVSPCPWGPGGPQHWGLGPRSQGPPCGAHAPRSAGSLPGTAVQPAEVAAGGRRDPGLPVGPALS